MTDWIAELIDNFELDNLMDLNFTDNEGDPIDYYVADEKTADQLFGAIISADGIETDDKVYMLRSIERGRTLVEVKQMIDAYTAGKKL